MTKPTRARPKQRQVCEPLERLLMTISQRKLAQLLDTSPSYVSQMLHGHRRVGIDMALRLERATDGAVTRRELRPDDWHRIWPELAEQR